MQVLVSGKDMKYLHIVCDCHTVVSLSHGGTFYIFTEGLSSASFTRHGCHFWIVWSAAEQTPVTCSWDHCCVTVAIFFCPISFIVHFIMYVVAEHKKVYYLRSLSCETYWFLYVYISDGICHDLFAAWVLGKQWTYFELWSLVHCNEVAGQEMNVWLEEWELLPPIQLESPRAESVLWLRQYVCLLVFTVVLLHLAQVISFLWLWGKNLAFVSLAYVSWPYIVNEYESCIFSAI